MLLHEARFEQRKIFVMNRLKYIASRNLINLPGWRTKRKIIVIQSDDWGSIRMPSKEVYQKMLDSGIPVDKCPYNRFDALESEEDLEKLYSILTKHKDIHGSFPVITANCVVANPDFDKIRESDFREYHYELYPETLEKHQKHDRTFELWNEGISKKIIFPQFHGREHVNIKFWLDRLIEGNQIFRKAFDLGLWGLGPNVVDAYNFNIQAAFDCEEKTELEHHKLILADGLSLFSKLFGFRSESFIANNFVWDTELDDTLAINGVTILQGMKKQYLPAYYGKNRMSVGHRTGELNKSGQLHMIRNCFFEPSLIPGNPVRFCLSDIQNAFAWHKPAIITSHRLNFMGGIVPSNRDNNLESMDKLLTNITQRWPEVEFMTTVQLGELIRQELHP